jgi:hypothetical protein
LNNNRLVATNVSHRSCNLMHGTLRFSANLGAPIRTERESAIQNRPNVLSSL